MTPFSVPPPFTPKRNSMSMFSLGIFLHLNSHQPPIGIAGLTRNVKMGFETSGHHLPGGQYLNKPLSFTSTPISSIDLQGSRQWTPIWLQHTQCATESDISLRVCYKGLNIRIRLQLDDMGVFLGRTLLMCIT